MMRTFGKIGWVYVATIVAGLVLASCGNSQKSKVQGKQTQQPAGAVIEESEVVVEVDSIVPDSTTVKQKTKN